MKKKKNIKVQSYKQIVKTVSRYNEKIKTDKALENTIIQDFIEKTKKFFTKSGNLRKNLSNKNKQVLNTLISGIKEKGLQSIKGIKQYNKEEKIRKQNEKREKTLVEKNLIDSLESAIRATELLQNRIVSNLMKVAKLDSSQILDIAEEDIDANNIDDVINYILKTYNEFTPAEILSELDNDSDFQLFNDYKLARENNVEFILQDDFNEKLKYYLDDEDFYNLTDEELRQEYKKYLMGQYNGIL